MRVNMGKRERLSSCKLSETGVNMNKQVQTLVNMRKPKVNIGKHE